MEKLLNNIKLSSKYNSLKSETKLNELHPDINLNQGIWIKKGMYSYTLIWMI